VPVSAFFEWRAIPGQEKKQKLRFTSPDTHPLALAGLWEHWLVFEPAILRTKNWLEHSC
jgi:putative SOS response-associated peptidase YedK